MGLLYYPWVPVAGILSVLVFHILVARLRKTGFLESVVWASFLGTFVTLILQGAVAFFLYPMPARESAAYLVFNLVIYGSLLYSYANFVNMGETARRIRLLIELQEAPGGLSREELLLRYNAQEIVTKRLDRLCVTGQIQRVDSDSFETREGSAMLRVARFVRTVKIFLLGKPWRSA